MGKGALVVVGNGPLPSPLTEIEKEAAVLSGDTERLILTHLRLGCQIADKFVRYGGDREEMSSVAFVAIVEGVLDFVSEEQDSITGHLVRRIHKHCAQALRAQDTIARPRSRGGPKAVPLNGGEAIEDDRLFEVEEILKSLPETPQELAVLTHRREGLEDNEIAEILDVHRTTVSRIRTRLYERYRRLACPTS